MELAAARAIGCVDADELFIAAAAWMTVHAPLAFVLRRLREVAEVDALVGGDVIQVRRLDSAHALGIGIVENPLVVLQIGEVAAAIKHAVADLRHDAAVLVLEEEIAPLRIAEPVLALREDVRGIP